MIIGLAGPAGVGKDTAADMLQRFYGFKRVAFAHTLKNMLAIAGMPEPEREHKEDLVPGLPFTWRKAAQTLGTEWGRSLDPDLWVKLTMRKIASRPGDYAISDVRFENEATTIRAAGGYIIHMSGRAVQMSEDTSKHVSEIAIAAAPSDFFLWNGGDIKSLTEELISIVHLINGTPNPMGVL